MAKRSSFKFLLAGLLIAVLALAGCSGNDGATGPQGPQGDQGIQGDPGPVTTTSEACMVCHTTDRLAEVAVVHPVPAALDQTVSNITVTNTAGTALPVVTFHVATTAGGVAGISASSIRVYIADLVPGDPTLATPTAWGIANPTYTDSEGGTFTNTAVFASDYFERWAYETGSGATLVDNGGGDYTFNLATAFGSAGALTEAPDYDPTHIQRLMIRVAGTTDVTNNTVGFLDFVVPGAGATAVEADLAQYNKVYATIDTCKKCHGPQMRGAAHASSYLDTRACVICHSPLGHYGGEMQEDKAQLSQMVHEIHAGIIEGSDLGAERGWDTFTFPQNTENCVICHADPNGVTAGTAAAIDNWKANPNLEPCASCHTTNTFNSTSFVGLDGVTYSGHNFGVNCASCHTATGAANNGIDIVTAHTIATPSTNVPEFDVTVTLDKARYARGDTGTAIVTLKNHADSTDVAAAVYQAAKDTTVTANGALSNASLYLYGPRAKAVPLTGTQANSLFGTYDATAGGFKFTFTVPADATYGTYMYLARIADFGYTDRSDPSQPWRIDSITSGTFGIGTSASNATSEKVAGDACVDCHGTGTAEFHDVNHSVYFDTDQCLSCHDQSGGHADPIFNRVHAVHSANSTGDATNYTDGVLATTLSRDWSDITYPQDVSRCVTCHTTSDTTYQTNATTMACGACHFGADGVNTTGASFSGQGNEHILQNGGGF